MILINLIFSFLNFLLLIAVFYYVIQRFIVPAVVNMIKIYDAFIHRLQYDRQEVISDYQLILKNIDEQEEQFQVVQVKFLVWEKKCNDMRLERLAQQKKVERVLHDRFVIRSQVVMNELAIKNQLPNILDQVTQQLQSEYQVIEFQKKYTKDLIDLMKEQV